MDVLSPSIHTAVPEQNHTEMLAADINYKLKTTDSTSHDFLVYDDLPIGNDCLYCSWIDGEGNEPGAGKSSSGCLNFTRVESLRGVTEDNTSTAVPAVSVYVINITTNTIQTNFTSNSTGGIFQPGIDDGIYLFCAMNKSNYAQGADAKIINVTN